MANTSLTTKTIELFKGAPLTLWAALRVSTLLVACLALLYENSGRIAASIRDYILLPWISYDTVYYVRIVNVGYLATDITSGFHPLFPWLARLVNLLFHDSLLSLLLVASCAGLLLTVVFYQLAKQDEDSETAWTATALFLCWPVTIAIFAPYTEALFLLLTTSCLLSARLKRYWLAGLIGGLAALTRQQGLFLVLPLAWEIWEGSNRDWRWLIKRWPRVFAVALVVAGYGFWIIYRAMAINDFAPDFSSPQRFIYSVMVSPKHYQVFAEQQFLPPWIALWKAIVILFRGGLHWSAYGDAFLALVFIAITVIAWKHLRTSHKLYCLAVVLIALSLHTGGTVNPYTSLPRHLLAASPVFIGLAAAYKFQRLRFVLLVLALCQALFLCCFVWQTWVL